KDWVSNSEDESETKIPQNVPSFVQPTKQEKSPRLFDQHIETSIPSANPKTAIPKPTSNGIRKNKKACFVCKILDHLIKDCDYHEKHVVPTTVVTKSTLVPINAAGPLTAVVLKPYVTRPRPAKPIVTKPHSPPRRHINHSPSPKARNMSYLSDFEELNGRCVTFGGNPKGGNIYGKSVSQICDKKNNVLFTEIECLVLSPEFKLPDENQEHDFDAKKPESEVNVSPSSTALSRKQDDKTKKEAKGKNITYSDDEDDVGAEVDFNNLETSITVSPIPATRVHKDHPMTQIIGDLPSATQTRKQPKRVHQALKDPSWIEAIREELLQFKMQKVWVLVDLPHGKRAIGFEDPDYPDKVYKVVKALYGVHQALKA
nr:hypothetical protein [Tanacetum cinerariifolium]